MTSYHGGFMARSQSPRILVVEDDKLLWHLWSLASSKLNINLTIDWATSELEAENLILKSIKEGSKYDLLIIDIFLEGTKTGLDLYKQFRHLFYNHIIITSGADYRHYQEYLNGETPVPYCMEKPLVPKECVKVLKKMLVEKNKSQDLSA